MFYNEKIFKRCFDWRGRYWYKNIKEIPLYFKLMHHLIKHGYDEYATWETFDWFIDTMKPVLASYSKNHHGYPCDFENSGEWYKITDHMVELLDLMDECNPKYETKEYANDYDRQRTEMHAAKDEFFQLFSKYFYNLWD
jgi:hypothetical protein